MTVASGCARKCRLHGRFDWHLPCRGLSRFRWALVGAQPPGAATSKPRSAVRKRAGAHPQMHVEDNDMVTDLTTRPVYAATLYHDSVDDAADDNRFLGYFSTLAAAVQAINDQRDDPNGEEGWFTGGVNFGELHAPVFGIRPEHFESDLDEPSWYVGTDGKADR